MMIVETIKLPVGLSPEEMEYIRQYVENAILEMFCPKP